MIPIRYNLRSVIERRATSLMTILGVALVAMIFVILLGFIGGLQRTLLNARDASQQRKFFYPLVATFHFGRRNWNIVGIFADNDSCSRIGNLDGCRRSARPLPEPRPGRQLDSCRAEARERGCVPAGAEEFTCRGFFSSIANCSTTR